MDIDFFDRYACVLGETTGCDLESRLLSSPTIYVRGQDEISVYKGCGSGRRLNSFELFKAVGHDIFIRIIDDLSVNDASILVLEREEPAKSIFEKRTLLGVEQKDVALRLGLTVNDIAQAEDIKQRNPIRAIDRISQVLDIDDSALSVKSNNVGDVDLGYRLKTTHDDCCISNSDILALSEAAWIIKIQHKLATWIKDKPSVDVTAFEHDDYYCGIHVPAWKRGYDLAGKTRSLFSFPVEKRIDLKALCEKILFIPVIQTKLSSKISGATISTKGLRGIVLNIDGQNSNPLVRRVTLAHELGHLLWDRDERLKTLTVHRYENMIRRYAETEDVVEQRARAFAVEFLAPFEYFPKILPRNSTPQEAIRSVMDHYCISFSSAKLHLWHNHANVGVQIPWEIEDVDTNPSSECRTAQNFTIDYFPLKNTSPQRVGLFSSYVARAYLKGYISADTGAHYLESSIDDFTKNVEDLADIQ